MSNIKGLYFKLNMDKMVDKEIYDFFNNESNKCSVNKIDLLFSMIVAYKQVRGGTNERICKR